MDTKRVKVEDGKPAPTPLLMSDEQLAEAVEKLEEVQDELEKVNERASDEILKVEQKYSKERKPIYERRSELIAKIPDFWATVLSSHMQLGPCLSSEDQVLMSYLMELTVEDFPDIRSGHTISMRFETNPFLENEVLTKTFTFSDDGKVKITGTNLRWKSRKETNGDVKEGKKRPADPVADGTTSFLRWFDVPEEEQEADGVEDEVAELIREDIWPNPLKYYVMDDEAQDEEGEEDEEGEDDEEGEEEEDDKEGEEGEDEEEGDDA